jgi:hypothetical protein
LLQKGAYSINESIDFSLKIHNETKKKLKTLKCELIQELKYKSSDSNKISEIECDLKLNGSVDFEWSASLRIGPVPTTVPETKQPKASTISSKSYKKSLIGDLPCSVNYYVQVKVRVSSVKKFTLFKMPIFIGSD